MPENENEAENQTNSTTENNAAPPTEPVGQQTGEALTTPPDTAEQTNPVEESKATGTATTDDGRVVATQPGAVPENAPDVSETGGDDPNRELTQDECSELVGELTQNEQGWIPLNEEGYITGAARRGQPPEGQHFAYVQCTGEGVFAGRGLTTPSGAPVTRKMNPDTRVDADHNENARKALEEEQAKSDENDGA